MVKLSLFYLLKYPLLYFYHTLLYFCHTKPIHIWLMLRNTFWLKITALYFLLQNLLPYPLPSSALADHIPPLGTTRKRIFPDLPLWVLNAMFLNNLIHQFIFLVLQHPRGLSFDLQLCISTNSQNVKHLAAAK